MISVNIEEGFLIHWSDKFLLEYGNDAEFPKAVSDLYTLRLAKMMDKQGSLVNDVEIALFSNEAAVQSLSILIEKCNEVGKVLHKEAFGTEEIGTVSKLVDSWFGDGIFEVWIACFEKGDYQSCENILRKPH